MTKYRDVTLQDITYELSDGLHAAPEFYPDGEYIFVNAKNLVNGRIVDCDKDKKTSYDEYLKYRIDLDENTVLYSIDGTIGNVAKYRGEKVVLGKGACYLKLKPEADVDYIFFYLQSPVFREYIHRMSTGSTIRHISLKTMRTHSLKLPDIDTQRKIAGVLSAIQGRIDTNKEINETLEEQAWALYEQLLCESECVTRTLGEVTKKNNQRAGDERYTVLSALNTGILRPSEEYFTKQVFSKDISKYITVNEYDFAYNPARVNIGSIGLNDLGYIGCVSPVYVAFSVDTDYVAFFRFYFRTKTFNEECKTRASGSVRQTLNYDAFSQIEIKYPAKEAAAVFDRRWTELKRIIEHNKAEIECLSDIRDSLLPKLMSGELDVSDVQL